MLLVPSHRCRPLLLVLDGRVALFKQSIYLFLKAPVLLLHLLQSTQIRVVTGHLLTVAFAQDVVFLLHPLQLIHRCIVELVQNLWWPVLPDYLYPKSISWPWFTVWCHRNKIITTTTKLKNKTLITFVENSYKRTWFTVWWKQSEKK